MSVPRESSSDRRDPGHHPLGEEVDPTGVRAILSALPDPGPMPADLVHRITTSLAAEQARRPDHRVDGPLASSAPAGGSVHSLTTARRRRAPGARLPIIAIAASIVVLAGAVVMGVLALGSGRGMSAGFDTVSQQALDDGATAESGGADTADPLAGTEMAPSGGDEGSALADLTPSFLATGSLVTDATLVEHARALRESSTALRSAAAESALAGSTVGTVEGAADCVGAILALAPSDAAALLESVDIVSFEGSLAAFLVVRDPPATRTADGPPVSTAYLVPLDCGPRRAEPLHEPVRIDS